MKYILVALCFLTVGIAEAYNPVTVTTDQPYEEIVIPMDSEAQKQSYLGVLENYPHLFEFSLTQDAILQIRTRQPVVDNTQPINLILLSVNVETNSLEEIFRLNTPIGQREKNYDSHLAIDSYDSDWIEAELEPGLYRLEVSTPVNQGSYELDFGLDSVPSGYLNTFKTIKQVQQHFGYPWTQYFKSSFFWYHLGVIVLIGSFWWLQTKRRKLKESPDVA